MGGAEEPVGTLDVALKHAVKLLGESPALAAEQAEEILKAAPQHPLALLIKGVSRRNLGDPNAALEILRPLAAVQPGWAPAHYELGVTLGHAGFGDEAVAALTRAVQLKTDIGDAWRLLADHYTAMGDTSAADAAYANHIKVSTRDPRLLAPAAALAENRIAVAEALLKDHLKKSPTDVAAIRMLAEVAARLGRLVDSENLLARCLELAPGFNAARHNYAVVLHRRNKETESLAEVERLMAIEPHNAGLRSLKAAILARLGSVDQAIEIYAGVLADYPRQAKVWMSYGHSLKTAGRQAESIDAYRRSLELSPGLGEAYWSLANLKTFRFSQQDVEAMTTQLLRTDLSNDDRMHFHFALGKALEDTKEYAASFEHYAAGNRLRREALRYDADDMTSHVRRSKALFTEQFFAQRAGSGAPAPDPIFVVGLPRAGSTLVEQILASHSAVEGTMELPDIVGIAADLGGRRKKTDASKYPEILASMDADELRALGERYLRQTRVQRKSDAPFFVDKLPNNWAHVGLIQLILPNARIIDARRHPLSCCFSVFKQHFARGQAFTYGLEDIGRYYRDYVDFMAHFDRVLPGRVHRVIYERMVEDTESEVRRLLEYCGLPFEEACLRFYENDRAVRTASSEQVRRPIYRESVDQWRNYDTWLQPLRDALGPVLDAYPGVPTLSNS
jgi:tetratricopeptide (TPR) repeat protein